MAKVSTESGEFPQSLFLQNVKFSPNTPIGWGGFASIFKGTYCKDVVAVKLLLLGPASVEEKNVVHKVCASVVQACF
jgi:hypothetical protein